MSELLQDRLGIHASLSSTGGKGDRGEKPQQKRRQVANIMEWVQCFAIYTAVVTATAPDRTQDLLGYMALVVEARMEYDGDTWLGYDRRFRQMVAASPGTTWAKIDPTLWNLLFTGQAKGQQCKHCFSLTHPSGDCDWAPTPPKLQPTHPPVTTTTYQRPRNQPPLCYSWNHNQDPNCSFPGCPYRHVCIYCAKDPQAMDKGHKAIHCPQ